MLPGTRYYPPHIWDTSLLAAQGLWHERWSKGKREVCVWRGWWWGGGTSFQEPPVRTSNRPVTDLWPLTSVALRGMAEPGLFPISSQRPSFILAAFALGRASCQSRVSKDHYRFLSNLLPKIPSQPPALCLQPYEGAEMSAIPLYEELAHFMKTVSFQRVALDKYKNTERNKMWFLINHENASIKTGLSDGLLLSRGEGQPKHRSDQGRGPVAKACTGNNRVPVTVGVGPV